MKYFIGLQITLYLILTAVIYAIAPKPMESEALPSIPIVFISSVKATAYRSVPAQTKPKGYYWTASGERCNVHGCAVSRDLLRKNGGFLEFGDLILVEKIGYKFVNDVMNIRHKQRIDVWVSTYSEEQAFDKKYKASTLKIWLVRKGN